MTAAVLWVIKSTNDLVWKAKLTVLQVNYRCQTWWMKIAHLLQCWIPTKMPLDLIWRSSIVQQAETPDRTTAFITLSECCRFSLPNIYQAKSAGFANRPQFWCCSPVISATNHSMKKAPRFSQSFDNRSGDRKQQATAVCQKQHHLTPDPDP